MNSLLSLYLCIKPTGPMSLNERTLLTEESGAYSGCRPRTPLEKWLVVVMLVIAAVGIGLCVTLTAIHRSESIRSLRAVDSNTCLTKECINSASRFLNSIDFDQDPCNNFYEFACGNWIKNSYLAGDMVLSRFTRLNAIIILRIKEFLETRKYGLSEHEVKIRNFYDACNNRDTFDQEGLTSFMEDLEYFGGWPMIMNSWNSSTFDWVELVGRLHDRGYPHDLLFSISVDMDVKNISRSLLVVDTASLGLHERAYYLLNNEPVMLSYKQLIFDLSRYFQPFLEANTTAYNIEYAVAVEKYLAENMLSRSARHGMSVDDFYNIMTLAEIEEFAPKVPWRALLTRLLPPKEVITNSTRLMVVSPKSLKAVNKLLDIVESQDGQSILANYMLYRTAIFAAGHLGKDLFTMLESRMHPTCHRELWQVCVESVVDLFHMSLTSTYAENYMDFEAKGLLENMFKDIQESLLNQIKSAPWLDRETREKALLKVTKSKSAIAYRDEILDDNKLNEYYKEVQLEYNHFKNIKAAYSFYSKEQMKGLNEERTRFKWSETTNVLQANAFYLPTQNSIIIPIGLLQDAFFAKGRPNYINYGSLGSILGHEYTHAFDSIGSLYDEEGNYRMWWTNQSWSNFQEKTKCFINQYNQFYEEEVKTHLNGKLTLGENIADNGGLLVAYHAYTKHLKKLGSEEKLPGLPFTEKQMFWISYATSWCKKEPKSILKLTMEEASHAPSQFRVIGALSNIPEFAKDFNCKKGSTLNPTNKCHLWE